MDEQLGRLIDFVNADPTLAENTAIILTTDHGGFGNGHGDTTNPEIFTIPLYIWIAGEQVGEELYDLNSATRLDPGASAPDYSGTLQPIRNGEVGNLALDLLGLPPIPGSVLNSSFDLSVVGTLVGDLNFDGSLNLADWALFLVGHGAELVDLSQDDAYAMGDLDGDFDNDIDDFVVFRSVYDAIHGQGALAASIAVPEPSSLIVAALACCLITLPRVLTVR